MSPAVYEALAYAMRYWFVIALTVILIAVILISVKQFRSRKHAFSRVNAFLGYVEIVSAPDHLAGQRFGVCDENTIGGGPDADIIIDDMSVNDIHALLYAEAGELFIRPVDGSEVFLNGYQIKSAAPLKTKDIIGVGDIDLCLFIKRKRVGNDY
mgnify:CR=1 FL=1